MDNRFRWRSSMHPLYVRGKIMRKISTLLIVYFTIQSFAMADVVRKRVMVSHEPGSPLLVHHSGDTFEVIPKKHIRYEDYVINKEGTILCVIAADHNIKDSWKRQSIEKIVLSGYFKNPKGYEPETIPFYTELPKYHITTLSSVSESEDRLLMVINRPLYRNDNSTRYKTHPYFLDIDTGRLYEVNP